MKTEEIRERLFSLQDEGYREFQAKLMPTVPFEKVIGVRTPALREFAKELYKAGEADEFLSALPHEYFEENQLHAFIISLEKDYSRCMALVSAFLPYVDNWATCDQMSPKVFKKHKEELLRCVREWLSSGECYTARFGIKMLMEHFLDADFDVAYLEAVAAVPDEEYYVHMMVAWYFATALAKQWNATLPFIEGRRLRPATHNKAIQKAVESYRITPEQKAYLKTLKGGGIVSKVEELKRIISEAKDICVFTGAGISVPSGIPDFRSASGLYNQDSGFNIRPEEIISHSFFMEHTDMFYEFYKSKMVYPEAKPNAAHKYFASLEALGKHVSVVTQNIDGLHSAAGSSEVYEIHGSVLRNNCMKCGKFYDVDYVMSASGVPKCSCGGTVKPDVVLYEEPLDDRVVSGAVSSIASADTLIIIGTSLVVYPAASYVRYFRGKNLVVINLEPTQMDSIATLAIYDDVVNVIAGLEE